MRRASRAGSTPDAGFTLIEVMIVMAIVAVIALAAVPNIMSAMKDQPLLMAVTSIKETFAFAKYKSVNDRNAYAVRVSDVGDPETGGVLEVFRGSGPHCGGIDMDTTDPIRGITANDVYEDYAEGKAPMVAVTSTFPDGGFTLCFKPDGFVVDLATQQPVGSAIGTATVGEAVVTLEQLIDGVAASSQHNVLIPFSGKPRVLFGNLEDAHGEGGT